MVLETVEGAGCASILNFNVPDEWHLITDYAINGAAKPSYEHAQAIWDSYLECLAVDKCKENTQYHPYLLREGDFEIPAIGYNALPMDSHRGLSDLPNAAGYRLYDRFELVYEKDIILNRPGCRTGSDQTSERSCTASAGSRRVCFLYNP